MASSATLLLNFSDKHKDYIRASRDCFLNVAEGAVRAGKTVDNVFAFAYELESSPDKLHLATGSTIANAKLNIGECNGLGLEYLFRGRCKWGKFKSNECLYVKTKDKKQKIVIFAGAAKADSYKKIHGNSYGMWIATEIDLHHKKAIEEGFDRQYAAKRRKIFWDLNPGNPRAMIYVDYIDLYAKKNLKGELLGGYNYQSFTLFDNINISSSRIEEIISRYDKNSIEYKRNILGVRCVAEGLIYRTFVENTDRFLVDDAEGFNFAVVMIGVDFGGNSSAHAFVATGITKDRYVVVLDEEYFKDDVDPDELTRRYCEFVRRVNLRWGPAQTRADSAEQVLIRGFRNKAMQERLRTEVLNSLKMPINERIRLTKMLLAMGRFRIVRHCQYLIGALCDAVWDPDELTEDIRLDNGSTNIDSLDAFEYSIEPYFKELMNYDYR